MFNAIARFSVRFRWFIIAAWIIAIPILTANFPSINDVTKNNQSDFLPKSSPTSQAMELESSFISKDVAGTGTVIAVRDSGLTAEDNAALQKMSENLKQVKGVVSTTDQGKSADGKARQIQVGFGSEAMGPEVTNVVDDVRAQMKKDTPGGLQTHLTGEVPQAVDATESNTRGRNSTEFYTVIFIIVLLLFVFRALLAPIVTILPAGLALAAAQPIIAESTKIGVEVSFITQILLIVLILGAGADYGLFLVFRVREELRKGAEPKEAVVRALSKVGESITFSALTVMAALMSLLLASFGIYKGLGPALAIALGVMLLVSLTFLPALLAILGRAVFWPSKTKPTPMKFGFWGKVADRVIERPRLTLVVGIVIFATLSLGVIGYKATGFGDNSAPAGTDSATGQQLVKEHFPAASVSPQLLLMRFNDSVWASEQNLQKVQTAQTELAKSDAFKAVSGPFEANGFSLTPQQLFEMHRDDPQNPILEGVAQFISKDGKTVQLYGVGSVGTPGSSEAANATPHNRAVLDKVADSVGATENSIFSNDAAVYDINKIATQDLKKIIPVVLVVIAVLLALLLRSLVAPWYLIATVGLSYLASLGFAMLAFVHLGGQDGLNFVLPFMMFIFCMALGEDYNILVMSRIREEAHGKVTVKQAVRRAIGITGTTVTSAGLILAGSFAVLGLVGGDQQIEQIGYSIAFGILLDTFFVRTLLVPSIVVLLGRWNWWPSKLHRDSE